MRAHFVVLTTPGFDDDARVFAAAEVLHREALVAPLAVETLVVTVLPRLARLNKHLVDALRHGELEQFFSK